MKKLILILTFASQLAFAVSESSLPELTSSKILPFFEALPEGEFQNKDNRKIHFHYLMKSENKRTLVLVTGRTETAMKYAEVIYDLKDKGFDIFIMDHQGQGNSERLILNSSIGHVNFFQDYVKDMAQFIEQVVKIKSNKPLYLMAHSLGGGVAAHYLNQYPETFVKAVLLSPMLEIETKPYNEKVAFLYSSFLRKTGKGNDFAPGRSAYNPDEDTFEVAYTSSLNRFEYQKTIHTLNPQNAIGGPSVRWVNEALKATKKIDRLEIKTPVLLFQADNDALVKPGRQNSFCKKSFCRKIFMEGSKHELMMEVDSIRNPVMKMIANYLDF
jgi:lysophospholipase